jgi:hypothetical protein
VNKPHYIGGRHRGGLYQRGRVDQDHAVAGMAVILGRRIRGGRARFSEVRTEWETNRTVLEAERASIEADPAGEFEELVGIYEVKGMNPRLARQVAEPLTELGSGGCPRGRRTAS